MHLTPSPTTLGSHLVRQPMISESAEPQGFVIQAHHYSMFFVLGLTSELRKFHRKWVLVTCVVLWSLMTSLAGFATQYWHLVVTRVLLGVLLANFYSILSIVCLYWTSWFLPCACVICNCHKHLKSSSNVSIVLIRTTGFINEMQPKC